MEVAVYGVPILIKRLITGIGGFRVILSVACMRLRSFSYLLITFHLSHFTKRLSIQ